MKLFQHPRAKAKDTAAKDSMNAWGHLGCSTHFPIYGYMYIFSFSPVKYHIPVMPVFFSPQGLAQQESNFNIINTFYFFN